MHTLQIIGQHKSLFVLVIEKYANVLSTAKILELLQQHNADELAFTFLDKIDVNLSTEWLDKYIELGKKLNRGEQVLLKIDYASLDDKRSLEVFKLAYELENLRALENVVDLNSNYSPHQVIMYI
jgi:hypothetical protein